MKWTTKLKESLVVNGFWWWSWFVMKNDDNKFKNVVDDGNEWKRNG